MRGFAEHLIIFPTSLINAMINEHDCKIFYLSHLLFRGGKYVWNSSRLSKTAKPIINLMSDSAFRRKRSPRDFVIYLQSRNLTHMDA